MKYGRIYFSQLILIIFFFNFIYLVLNSDNNIINEKMIQVENESLKENKNYKDEKIEGIYNKDFFILENFYKNNSNNHYIDNIIKIDHNKLNSLKESNFNLTNIDYEINKIDNNNYSKIYNNFQLEKLSKIQMTTNYISLIPMLFMGKYTKISNEPKIIRNLLLENDSDVSDDDDLFKVLIDFLRKNVAKEIISNLTLSESCKNNFTTAYIDDNNTTFYYLKIIIDSTKNKNDVGSFQDCILNNYGNNNNSLLQNFQYVVVKIDKPSDKSNKNDNHKSNTKAVSEYENGFFIFGMCMIKGCDDDEIIDILKEGNRNIKLLDPFEKDNVKVFSLGNEVYDFNYEDLLNLIPLFLILIQLIFTLFPSLAAKIIAWFITKTSKNSPDVTQNNINTNNNNYRGIEVNEILNTNPDCNTNNNNTFGDLSGGNVLSCKNTNNGSNEDTKNNINYNEKYNNNVKKIEKIFSLLRNIQDLFLINFTKENIKPTYDFSSIGYIIGIRGIAMFSIILGYVYLILFESPIKIYCQFSYFNLIKSFLYNIISTGIRFSPRILFACSGYCLSFKLLNYFDKKMKLLNDGGSEDRFFDEQNFFTCEDNSNDRNRPKDNPDQYSNRISKFNHKLPFKYLVSFLMKQFHKYLLYVFSLFFFKYCLYTLFSYIGQIGPMWVFFKKNSIDKYALFDMILQIFLLDNVFNHTENNFFYLFWIISLEIKFFIFTSILLFIAFRRNNRLDIMIVFFIPFIMLSKILLFFILNDCLKLEFYPTIYFKSNLYNYVSMMAIYNYSFYSIGIIFGSINYIHQKSLTFEDIKNTGKNYLIIPLKLYNLFVKFFDSKKNSPKVLMFLLILIGIFLASSQFFFLLKIKVIDELNDEFFSNIFQNCFYLVDVEIFIIILFIICSGISSSENNIFFDFLKSNYWVFKNKIYFGFILMMNPLICYIFYQSESRVKIEFFNVLFLSIVCYMNLFIYSSLYFVIADAPLKKLNRYILKLKY